MELAAYLANAAGDLGVLAVEQISYASRYTQSRKQRSFCATAYGCVRDRENKQQ